MGFDRFHGLQRGVGVRMIRTCTVFRWQSHEGIAEQTIKDVSVFTRPAGVTRVSDEVLAYPDLCYLKPPCKTDLGVAAGRNTQPCS